MTHNRKWMFAALAAAIGVALVTFAILRPGAERQTAVEQPAAEATGTISFLMEQQWLIHMKLALVEEATVAPQITATGRVVAAPRNRAVVAPPVGGIMSGESLPRIGQNVTRGQVLATLTQTPTAAESSQIRIENARLDAEKRRLTQAIAENQARLNLAKSEFDRATRLYEKKAYSRRQLESAEADYRAAESLLAGVSEQLKALDGPVTVGNAYLVRAPISGTVVEVAKANGEQVQAGESILEIINLDTVWVEAPIFERDLARLRPQTQASFTTASYPDTQFRGNLVNLGSIIDEHSRAATAVFEVPNPERRLRIGMQANVRLDAQESVKALMIPREAVLENEGKKIVYVLLSGEEFVRREVEVGDEYGDKVAVLAGLKAGERVVTQGAYQLKLQELQPAGPVEHSHEV